MSKANILRNISIGFFISSFIAGFAAAFIHDFYPQLEGFHSLFCLKAFLGTFISGFTFMAYLESKQ